MKIKAHHRTVGFVTAPTPNYKRLMNGDKSLSGSESWGLNLFIWIWSNFPMRFNYHIMAGPNHDFQTRWNSLNRNYRRSRVRQKDEARTTSNEIKNEWVILTGCEPLVCVMLLYVMIGRPTKNHSTRRLSPFDMHQAQSIDGGEDEENCEIDL